MAALYLCFKELDLVLVEKKPYYSRFLAEYLREKE
jgi:hypothetical protein